MAVDFSNPCAVLTQLKQAHFDLVTGKAVASVSHEGRMVTYTRSDIASLERAIAKYDGLCAASTGAKTRRFAISTGGQ